MLPLVSNLPLRVEADNTQFGQSRAYLGHSGVDYMIRRQARFKRI